MLDDVFFMLSAHPFAWPLLASFIGACFGSLSNALAWRWPRMIERDWFEEAHAELSARGESIPRSIEDEVSKPKVGLSFPRSMCVSCSAPVPSWLNIPLFSWLSLRGKAACCGASIPSSYFIAELGGLLVGLSVGLIFAPSLSSFATLFLCMWAYCLAVVDAKSMYLPDAGNYFLLWFALCLKALGVLPGSLASAVLGAAGAYLLFMFIAVIGEKVLRRPALGQGDWKFFAAIVAWVGPAGIPAVLLLSSLSGLAYAIASKISKKESLFPFGPFLASGAILFALFGEQINALLMGG